MSQEKERGFAAMDPEERRRISEKGGETVSKDREHMSEIGRKGGEASIAEAPAGTGVFTAPAVWRGGSATWVFVANSAGTAGYLFRDSKLDRQWEHQTSGTSPVVAGGLLYLYDPDGGLNVYDPESGHRLAGLPAGQGHWSSPIAINGKVALPEGNANDHGTDGILNIYRLP